MNKNIPKHYIYMRDQQQCYHCGKKLDLGKTTLDHYLPKSKGGTYDVFNLVSSCRRCNRFKNDRLPDDWESVWIVLFIKAVIDRRMIMAIPSMKYRTLESMIHDIVYSSKAK